MKAMKNCFPQTAPTCCRWFLVSPLLHWLKVANTAKASQRGIDRVAGVSPPIPKSVVIHIKVSLSISLSLSVMNKNNNKKKWWSFGYGVCLGNRERRKKNEIWETGRANLDGGINPYVPKRDPHLCFYFCLCIRDQRWRF